MVTVNNKEYHLQYSLLKIEDRCESCILRDEKEVCNMCDKSEFEEWVELGVCDDRF